MASPVYLWASLIRIRGKYTPGKVGRKYAPNITEKMKHSESIALKVTRRLRAKWKGGNLTPNSADETIGKHISMLYPDYSHSYLRDDIIPTLLNQGKHEYETTLLGKGGKEFVASVSLSVLKDEAGSVVGMIGYTVDISEKKRFQQALADSEKRLANIIDFLPDPTWVIDSEHHVLAWNRAIEKATGIKKKEIIGRGDYEYAIPFYGKRRPVLIDLVLKRDKKWEQEHEKLIAELQDAVSKVRTLSGMLPICASCKKIRDDTGYWNQIESYIHKHSDAEFSHGICPECAEKLYPEFKVPPDQER